jgi:two-component system, sensor histidine kinase and response regulator
MERESMEPKAIEKEIVDKAKEWVNEYGEDFLVELIDVFLDEAPGQLAQMQLAAAGHESEIVSREAHSLKSSSANLGATTLSGKAQQIELAGRSGNSENLAAQVCQLAAIFAQVKSTLEALRRAPAEFIGQER